MSEGTPKTVRHGHAIRIRQSRADQKTGGALRKFFGRIGMHGKSRVSSPIKYDCFKLDDSGN